MAEDGGHRVAETEKFGPVQQAVLRKEVARRAHFRAVAHKQEPRGHFPGDAAENRNDVRDAFHLPEIRNVDDHLFVARFLLEAGAGPERGVEFPLVEEVGDDAQVFTDAEDLGGFPLQVFRDRSDAVAFQDGIPGEVLQRGEGAYQCHVRAVERGDNPWPLPPQHLAGRVRGQRVRDGVMDMQNVEFRTLRDFRHFGGEEQDVGRLVLEQRVVDALDLVEKNARVRMIAQFIGQRRGDEVNRMARVRKGLAKLGGHGPASAEGGITGDSNLHGISPGTRIVRRKAFPGAQFPLSPS